MAIYFLLITQRRVNVKVVRNAKDRGSEVHLIRDSLLSIKPFGKDSAIELTAKNTAAQTDIRRFSRALLGSRSHALRCPLYGPNNLGARDS